ncbi:MarR family transcriptional regulator [Acinetobacter pollinis]|uniref:MarR family transcriptional regulator n=1 Tax=Acinetobacter pollinis TaxID=2605270 RepID=UPI0018A30569|nr:MarR family transcriptional regulator [Acinetobacter pollinis]MBF7691286.1 MarR family transcriptional regulator [Acinetobacter pollinis]MBF7698686.1 MarR family transcriptional regulator [Acinetobacter pollinis]
MIKSQDILVLVKLISIEKQYMEFNNFNSNLELNFDDLSEIELDEIMELSAFYSSLSVRGLAESIVVSKSEVSECLKRLIKVGLLIVNSSFPLRRLNLEEMAWKVNRKALLELIIYSFQYFFHTEISSVDIGIPTVFNNNKLSEYLSYSSSLPYVWPTHSYRSISGLSVQPLHKSVPYASLDDNFLYEVFSLIDVFRIGSPRERKIAENLLREYLL